jgi:hypothetical protein
MAAPLVIGGRERPLRFDLDAIVLAEDTLEHPIRPLITRNRALTATQIITLAWATWRAQEPALTRDTVRGWVRAYCPPQGTGSLLHLENAVIDALVESGILIPAMPADPARPSNGATAGPSSTPPEATAAIAPSSGP